MENRESHGILTFHFPGLGIHGILKSFFDRLVMADDKARTM